MCFFPVQFSKICASLLPSVLDDIIIFILHCQAFNQTFLIDFLNCVVLNSFAQRVILNS